jgi:ABC-type nitrate/sulfonate/bicarbonate transport system ATPase subunit
VRDNVLLANRFARRGSEHITHSKSDAEFVLQNVGLPAKTWDKWPKELSVGMRKRVELARILLYRPKIILADEPFAALDIVTKRELSRFLLEARERDGAAVIISSHDLDDIVCLCERVFVLSGSPSATVISTVDNPCSPTVPGNEATEEGRVRIKAELIRMLEG